MKFSQTVYAVNLLLLSLYFNLFAQSTLAVLPFFSSGISSQESRNLTERFRAELTALKKYSVLDRTSMETLLADQGFNLNDPCKENSCAVTLGQLLAVDNIIIGNIDEIDKSYMVNIKMVNISSGSIIKDISGSHRVKKAELINEVIPAMALDLTSTDTASVRVFKKKRRPLIPVTLITIGTAALAVPAYILYKKYFNEEPKTREIEVQW